ncbi:uncharacterized protein LTR77_002552 [Saxophila tyrrhenica]|uniref:Uncharacterized protein n=1 Tax=Saxophila tyrrhenica TaxID=1690608 RepID=A0AAV9PKW2_9PEZI|nr:hypothetical protein LTR77_002552 [Saxophila tyrrhenica]
MVLVTSIVALSQKVSDDKKKRNEAKQGQLSIGDSDEAKDVFSEGSGPGLARTGTEIKFETPADVSAGTESPPIYSQQAQVGDARHTSQIQMASPMESEKATPTTASPSIGTPATPNDLSSQRPRSSTLQGPPSYSSGPEADTDTLKVTTTRNPATSPSRKRSSFDSRSLSTRSTNSQGTHAIRVKTRGADLKSGFPYHPALFDLRVHPGKWETFTTDIVSATKSTTGDTLKVWGAATGLALAGAWATSIFVGRTMSRQLQERRVKDGLASGSLGDKLKLWNEEYFIQQNLFVHLELSESAMKNQGKSTAWRKPTAFYSKDEGERKRDERKFVIVVTKLDDDGQPREALHELGVEEGAVEIGSSNGVISRATELPGDEGGKAVELPGETPVELSCNAAAAEKANDKPYGFAEMDGDNSHLLEKMQLESESDQRPTAAKT